MAGPSSAGDGRLAEELSCRRHDQQGWIVVSGLSKGYQWGRGPDWQWVRIVNPFDNEVEDYTYADFSASWVAVIVDETSINALVATYSPVQSGSWIHGPEHP
jgi:hypothetical protein